MGIIGFVGLVFVCPHVSMFMIYRCYLMKLFKQQILVYVLLSIYPEKYPLKPTANNLNNFKTESLRTS